MKKSKPVFSKILMLLTATILITMTMTSMAIDVNKKDLAPDIDLSLIPLDDGRAPNHHKVLAEQGTATWCVHCPSMGYWLAKVSGDFAYVALITDVGVIEASLRCSELGLGGYPTTFFDGGYTSVIGHQYSVTNLQNAYNTCQARTVSDLTLSVGAALDEDTGTVEVVTFIDNNEVTEFNGRLRVFVTEITSRWDDFDGDPYKYAFVGYATNALVNIPAEDTETRTGSKTFPLLTVDNTLVIAALYDSSNGYLQQCATVKPTSSSGGGGIDVIPPVLTIENPLEDELINGTVEISGSAHHPKGDGNLKWTLVKIDDDDWITADGTSDWSYTWDTTSVEDGEHVIRAVTSDGKLSSGVDKITVLVSNYNYAPETPSAPTGPEEGYAGELLTYTATTTDPDGDEIKYGFDWDGDDVVDQWTDYVASGTSVDISHSWDEGGDYQVKVKAEDMYQEQSSFSSSTQVQIFGSNTVPTVTITNPEQGIYLNNQKIIPFPMTIIIGDIDIIADASDAESGIDYLELFIDGVFEDDSFSEPYEWNAMKLKFGKHTIRVVAYDTTELSSEAEISVFKLF